MRLHVAVREGDLVAYTPFGCDVAWLMINMKEFRAGSQPHSDARRWKQLDAKVLSETCSVEVNAGTLVKDLTEVALKAARAANLAQRGLTGRKIISRILGRDIYRVLGEGVSGTWLADPATNMKLDPALSVEAANLEDGDLVFLCIEHPPRGKYTLMPAPNPRKMFSQLELSENTSRLDGAPMLRGLLLYTDADIEIATFVRTHFDELNALSGSLLQVFVMERPASWPIAKRYWKPRIKPELYRSLAALRWLSWRPYEKFRAHDVARQLGISVSDIPCLVLFNTHQDDRKFVFPIVDPSAKTFRHLFGAISEVIDGGHGQYSPKEDYEQSSEDYDYIRTAFPDNDSDHDSAALARLLAAEERLRAELRSPAQEGGVADRYFQFRGHTVFLYVQGDPQGGKVSDQFNFFGQTSFINRPTNTVISDFQNRYTSEPANNELVELLRLVLSSGELEDEGKEQAALLIHEAATEMESAQPKDRKIRAILESVKETTSRAADIAGPALGIISKVIELLNL